MDVALSRASVPNLGPTPELDRHPFDHDLWARLETMEIDPPGATTQFRHRLKEYNKWTDEFADGVINEYRRFLYLAARAGHPVTPSEAVDQAWHLHLTYTRHYWEGLCGNILGLPLHHEPSAGGALEDRKFERQYLQTIESYKAAFGEAPPADVWPVRQPGRGKKFGKLVAGAAVIAAAIALNSPPLLVLGFFVVFFSFAAATGSFGASDGNGDGGDGGAGGCGGGGGCGGCGG
ncbi:MAG: hypothetical protein K2Y71_07970 [Xanthobacteraceae bacterium]|nr:hypothetical protein [Xanthobacteraceae bacterium]